jgi:hypothetical protein
MRTGNAFYFPGVITNINFKSLLIQNGIAEANQYYRLDDGNNVLKNSNTQTTDVVLPNSFLVAGAADISGNVITGNNNLWAYI